MTWTALASALVLFAPVGNTDPDVALKEINTYRTEQITKARDEGTRLNLNELNAKVKSMALKAIEGVTPGKIEPAKGYSWMQLFVMAEKYEHVEELCKQYMTSKPTEQEMFDAEIACLNAFYNLKEYSKGVKTIQMAKPPTTDGAITLLTFANSFVGPLAEEQGKEAAMKFIDGVVAKVPDNVEEKLKPRVDSAVRSLTMSGTRIGLIGAAPPAIPFDNKYGEFSSLEDLKGKVVMVDFMAHWCGPCIAAFPSMVDLYKKHKGDGLEILSVTRYYGYIGTENRENRDMAPQTEFEKMADFNKKHNITWPMAFTTADTFTEYGITGIPTMAIIGRDGTVRKLHVGFSEASFKEVVELVDELLKEKA